MSKAECIIIGGGLAGLACARTLHKNGVEALVIEADNVTGGRVKTFVTSNGVITDVGFQVLLSSYPELYRFVDLNSLNLKKFNSGALVFSGESFELLANPLVHPENLISTAFSRLLSIKDKALVLKLIAISQFQKSDVPLGVKSTELYLKDFGFSEKFIEIFWRPFLTGIFLDPELEIGYLFFKFLMRCFSTGNVTIPENGMAELPRQIGKTLPSHWLLLNQRVKSFSGDSVVLQNGDKISAKKVICSVDFKYLNNESLESNYRMVTTHYFTGENLELTGWNKWLALVPRQFGFAVDHFCLISSVSEKYGNGNSLLSVSVVGKKDVPVSQLKQELNQLAKRDLKLDLVITHTVPKALPRYPESSASFKKIDNVVYCGDRWSSPSINGALRSGRLAAESILNEIKK